MISKTILYRLNYVSFVIFETTVHSVGLHWYYSSKSIHVGEFRFDTTHDMPEYSNNVLDLPFIIYNTSYPSEMKIISIRMFDSSQFSQLFLFNVSKVFCLFNPTLLQKSQLNPKFLSKLIFVNIDSDRYRGFPKIYIHQ